MSAPDPRFLKGLAHFNDGEFYDAHEVWEDLWHTLQGPDADFIKGLIQYATALHHFRRGNLKGTRTLVSGGTALLAPFDGEFWGVPVKKLRDDMAACAKDVLAHQPNELPGRYDANKDHFPVKINEALIPKIGLRNNA